MATTLGNGTITFGDGTTLSSASMIQSIQRGTASANITAGGTGAMAGATNISAVVTAKCMVIITGAAFNGYSSGPVYFTTFNSTTQFAWYAVASAQSSSVSFGWQVIEFK